ncbi:hypothetical protein BFJ72_g3036 [Fusarium proliferatum]|uniref:Uncharacterized protein n=1 Tax=Gibberella intermedia TaxID=948311 RepID=A0A420TXS5_GIBIN|nr:hypothetical protein BFJ72_g3036 [Fusarium proliferatum]
MDLEQSVDSPDSSPAQNAAERGGTSADPEPRVCNICGLCKFRFHEGQAAITVDRNNSTLPLTWDDKYYPENEILHAYPYGQKAFHTGCFQTAGDVVFAKGFLESCTWNLVKFRFHYDSFTQPPPSFVARRTRRLRSSLSLEIRHAIKNRLPIEVCENIATYCLSEYATNLHLDAWQRRGPSGLNKDYIEIEGHNYVKSLSAVRMNENDTMVFMVKPKPNSWMGLKMYFTEDSLGVRSVIASSGDGNQSTGEPGLRWVSIPSKTYNLPFYIRMNFDGLKLRNLDVTQYERGYHYEQRARWAILPRDLGYLGALSDNIETGHGAAVQAVDWNLPGVSGYVIGLHWSFIDYIVPYRSGKLSPALLDAYDNAASTCLYFPVDPDERISELWLRSGDFPCDDDDALTRAESLIVVTSSGRSLVLGPDIRSRSSRSNRPLNYEALADLPSTTSTRTFYYKYKNRESWLGFEKITWHERKIKLSFGPPAMPGPYDWPDRFFSTSAELENLQTITPCRGWGDCVDNEIFGLLFTYTDGRQRSVGQIRLDHFQDSINISDMDMQYLEIPLRGKLEWRSTWGTVPTESDVRHLGSEACKLQSEMDQVLAHEASSGTASKTAVKTFSVHTGDMCFYEEEYGF